MMKNDKNKPVVAIVGAPNVGKSTLFNRLLGQRLAITSQVAGTTRDRLMVDVDWQGMAFTLIDTAGLNMKEEKEELPKNMMRQVETAINEADVVVFLVDGQDGIDQDDLAIATRLRQSDKPLILAINKAESPTIRDNLNEFYRLGLGEPVAISSIHGTGVAELLDLVNVNLEKLGFEKNVAQKLPKVPRIAIIGRPNVGKSTLLNQIAGEERTIVSDIPGTTRDIIDTKVETKGISLVLVDTAGIRRRGKIERGVEKFSVLRAEQAVHDSDLAVVIIDATEGPVRGDVHVITSALEAGKPVVIAVNKMDLVKSDQAQMGRFSFMQKLPLFYISAKTGRGVDSLLDYFASMTGE